MQTLNKDMETVPKCIRNSIETLPTKFRTNMYALCADYADVEIRTIYNRVNQPLGEVGHSILEFMANHLGVSIDAFCAVISAGGYFVMQGNNVKVAYISEGQAQAA